MARILVIDDNADLLQMIRLLLEERGGYEVTLSAEGEDGLEKAAADPPDLAIVDVMMPGMTGYEVCQRLRSHPATADIPIIILTARGQEVDRRAALEAGADVYIAKPVTMADLLGQVNSLMARKGAPGKRVLGGAVAFLSLRGGVGTTTLAVNLAAMLQTQRGGGVCLVDLCSSSGSAALQLGLRPDPNWSALATMSGQPGASTIDGYLLKHASGLRILASPFVPVVGNGLPKETVLATLSALGESHSLTIIDLPSILNHITMATLEVVDTIALVLAADPPSIQATLGTLQALKAFDDKIRLVLNQIVPGQQLPREALERVLRRPLDGIVPFDPTQAETLSQGQPLALSSPDSALPQAIAAAFPSLGTDVAEAR
ncbi:MAG: response regulator [Anaerolineae bacterium]|jgi:CheY-like chemotaxis protein